MAFSNELPSVVIPPRTEGGPEYPADYDPADELSGIPPWDPNYVPPDPPAGDTQSILNPWPAPDAGAPAAPPYQQP